MPTTTQKKTPVSTITLRFRRYALGMGGIIVLITLLLFWGQKHLSSGLMMLEEKFMPQWQTAQQLQGRVQFAVFEASQMSLSTTTGELETIYSGLAEDLKLLEETYRTILKQIPDPQLHTNLSTTYTELIESITTLKSVIGKRIESENDAGKTPRNSQQARERERDLMRLVHKDAIVLAGYTNLLASESSHIFQAQQADQHLFTRLQLAFITCFGILLCILVWLQYRLLDHRLLRRIADLQSNVTQKKLQALHHTPTQGQGDEIDALYGEFERLLLRLDEQRQDLEQLNKRREQDTGKS